MRRSINFKRAGKTMGESFEMLKRRISHVHFHDGFDKKDGKAQLLPAARRIVDLKKAVKLFMEAPCEGSLSGEWINREPPDVHLPRKIIKGHLQHIDIIFIPWGE